MQGTPAVSLGGYFEVDFSREDYFEDYFFRKIVLRSKIVSESKIVSKWKINLKITLRKTVSKIVLVDALALGTLFVTYPTEERPKTSFWI